MARGELASKGVSSLHWLASSSMVARAAAMDSVSPCLSVSRLGAS